MGCLQRGTALLLNMIHSWVHEWQLDTKGTMHIHERKLGDVLSQLL